MIGRLTTLIAYNVACIVRSRREFILVPLISTIASMLVVPYGLRLFTGSVRVGEVVATGLLVSTIFLPSTISGLYTVIELSVGSLDRYLILPVPRYYIVLSRLFASSVISLVQVSTALALALLQGINVSVVGAVVTYTLAFILSLGVTGIVLLLCVGSLDPRKVSLIASITNVVLLNLSPLYFPLSALPPWLRILMLLNPATPTVECIRQSLTSNALSSQYLLLAVILNMVWLTIGTRALVRRLEKL